ncbi:formyl-CoA transferase/CoA:oxalate CoA-transferase [Actinomadura meyerae]|uniref:Formyl-CoA transferase/CoA:oxalate CoA-transferase n=1 Tax=Actinomadura meyerae TaxID=240840 RepID=A0A239NEP2_9ACTN|nr:CoA transferase [Actinomadura meyerae]SNT53386.1 formyl-CoA transferase/CoA:oxalate CoA-transferase [Actinomadura meyerae]
MRGSLDGVRVVDLTTSVAGPFATMVLGDLGADVVKIERPGTGDDTRHWGPPTWDGQSCHFNALNRNKRSVTLDLSSPEGIADLRALAATADVLVENLRPGSLERKGLGYEALRADNPRLVYCSITGYGPSGPLRQKPAYDPLMQAFSGLMGMVGAPGSEPARIPVSILDQGSAMWAVIGVLDALRSRERSGSGSHVQTSLLGTALMWQPVQVANYLAAGELPQRLGSGTIGIYPYGAFPTADRDIVIAAGNQRLWVALCEAIGRPELPQDARFASNPARVSERATLGAILSDHLRGEGSDTWLAKLEDAGVPCSPINTLDTVLAHEQVERIGAVPPIPHPQIDGYRAVVTPLADENGPITELRPAPDLGEHTDEVLAEIRGTANGARP